MSKLALFILPIFIFTGCFASTAEPVEEIVFCPADVQSCTDGSFVARDAENNCQFTACPTSITPISMSDSTSTIILKDLPTTESAGQDLQTRAPAVGDTIAQFTTNHGEIWLRLFGEQTPKTVENFSGLAERGYYDGLIFHRVIPDFMIQGGDPDGRGTGGSSIWGSDFEDEFNPDLSNIRGALAMANRGPNTNGSQFFIVQNPDGATFLDGRHSVFGQTFAGLAVVDEIAAVPRDAADKPKKDVVLEKVQIFTVVQ